MLENIPITTLSITFAFKEKVITTLVLLFLKLTSFPD